jgi:hypothetical protein
MSMNLLSTLSDINSKVRELTNSNDSDLPPTESGMSDSMRSLIGSQSQGTRDKLPHEQVDHYTPLSTNNYNYIYRGSELYYQPGNTGSSSAGEEWGAWWPGKGTTPRASTSSSGGIADDLTVDEKPVFTLRVVILVAGPCGEMAPSAWVL